MEVANLRGSWAKARGKKKRTQALEKYGQSPLSWDTASSQQGRQRSSFKALFPPLKLASRTDLTRPIVEPIAKIKRKIRTREGSCWEELSFALVWEKKGLPEDENERGGDFHESKKKESP